MKKTRRVVLGDLFIENELTTFTNADAMGMGYAEGLSVSIDFKNIAPRNKKIRLVAEWEE